MGSGLKTCSTVQDEDAPLFSDVEELEGEEEVLHLASRSQSLASESHASRSCHEHGVRKCKGLTVRVEVAEGEVFGSNLSCW